MRISIEKAQQNNTAFAQLRHLPRNYSGRTPKKNVPGFRIYARPVSSNVRILGFGVPSPSGEGFSMIC